MCLSLLNKSNLLRKSETEFEKVKWSRKYDKPLFIFIKQREKGNKTIKCQHEIFWSKKKIDQVVYLFYTEASDILDLRGSTMKFFMKFESRYFE